MQITIKKITEKTITVEYKKKQQEHVTKKQNYTVSKK